VSGIGSSTLSPFGAGQGQGHMGNKSHVDKGNFRAVLGNFGNQPACSFPKLLRFIPAQTFPDFLVWNEQEFFILFYFYFIYFYFIYFYGQMKHCRKAKDRTEAKDEQEYFELRGVSTFNHQFRTYSCELGITSMFLTLVQNTFYYRSTERAQ
jgi:hypothetical protein